jgi:hypothetical protein
MVGADHRGKLIIGKKKSNNEIKKKIEIMINNIFHPLWLVPSIGGRE